MALNDVIIYEASGVANPGTDKFAVAASATLINAGEPVGKALAATVVAPLATNKPVVGTDYMAGIAQSTSTNTASAAGTVQVFKLVPGVRYLGIPKVAASWDTQAEYDALVGSRVLFDLTAGSYTVLAADSANNGLVVEPLDVSKYPGKVCFSIRAGASYLA